MAKKEEEIRVAGDTLARNLDEIDRLTAELKAKDERIWQLKLDIKVISECKIHCKNCNARIKQALKENDNEMVNSKEAEIKLLKRLYQYGEEGLTIDANIAREIEETIESLESELKAKDEEIDSLKAAISTTKNYNEQLYHLIGDIVRGHAEEIRRQIYINNRQIEQALKVEDKDNG